VLASASPRRAELLRSLGLAVAIVPSGYGEPVDPSLAPAALAASHAGAKLAAVRPDFPRDVVVAADTVVDVDGVSLGKPAGPDEAAHMLRLLSGRHHLVHTAYAVALPGRSDAVERLCTTSVTFCALDEAAITEYVQTGEPYDKAGGYGIQGRAAALVASIDGDYFTVVGFPLGAFVRDLRRSGFLLPSAK
jgi:septum formation protein